MNFWQNLFTKNSPSAPVLVAKEEEVLVEQEAVASAPVMAASYAPLFTLGYNGEKNIGDIGPIINYTVDYDALSARGWQLFLDSEICQLVISRFARWVISKGLMLKAQPSDVVLELEGIKVPSDFGEKTEARWKLFSESKRVDIKAESNLNQISKRAFMASRIGGDVLVILRLVGGNVQVQLVEGGNVRTPMSCALAFGHSVWENGNKIIGGVEVDANGKHVAYHIAIGIGKSERVLATDEQGRRVAYLVTGLKYKLNSTRAMPLITAVMETSAKLDRYKEATVGSAEEAAKVSLVAEHQPASTGENPFGANLTRAKSGSGSNAANGENPVDASGRPLADMVVATTGKQLVNMPIGATLKSVESKKEIHFADFYLPNIQIICAVVGIPPEVALMKYDSNFSASRAALKDWEHTLLDEREEWANQFYKPIYEYWLDVHILSNKIQAEGYITAMRINDYAVLDAYRSSVWLGANVPHIDPVKEVRAEREKLGPLAAHIPLTTVDKSTFALNGGDYWENMKNFSKEIEEASEEGINPVVATPVNESED